MIALVKRFWTDRRGATAVEYAVVLSILGVIIFAAMQAVGTGMANTFNNLAAVF